MPMISTFSPTLTIPRSIRPVATVPRPLMPNTSSTGIKNGLVGSTHWGGDVAVHRVHQLPDALGRFVVARQVAFALQRFEGRATNDRHIIAGELVLAQEFAHFQFDQFEQLFVVHHVDFVEEDHHGRHFHLPRQQDVLTGLRHRAIRGTHHQDRSVHLGGSGDHVLDVVGVPGAVHVGVVPLLGLVLQVGDGDGDPTLALFGGLVDLVEGRIFVGQAFDVASTLVMAAVRVVLPWSMCPIVPTFTCGLFRSNFFFAMPFKAPPAILLL